MVGVFLARARSVPKVCNPCAPPAERASTSRMIRRLGLPLAVAAVTALCFIPSLSGSFLDWDDSVNFGNRDFRGLGVAQIRWAFTSALSGHYIPLTRLSYSLNYVLGGLDPWGYHVLNVVLHAAN